MEHSLANLLKALVGGDGRGRKKSRETLSLLGETGVPQLRELLSSSDKLSRWEAAKCLAAMVEPSCLSDFVELLDDEHSDVRWLAGGGLIALGPRSVSPVLESLVQHPDSLGRQQAARRILRALSSENDVLAEIVAPVVAVLDHNNSAVIAARAAAAQDTLQRMRLVGQASKGAAGARVPPAARRLSDSAVEQPASSDFVEDIGIEDHGVGKRIRSLEIQLSELLRRRAAKDVNVLAAEQRTLGDRMADSLTNLAGSWRFIGSFVVLIALWMALNAVAAVHHWDP